MKRLFFCAVWGLFVCSAFAQGIGSAVKITSKNVDSKSLRVYEVERETEIVGNYSSTTIEYMIENRTNRILEGEFEFPLSQGESVVGYALDINGTMRQGVVVEKEKGRQVFEEIVRRGVDPGLVEKTVGNNFKTRVYPIPANGVRHLQVTVEKEVTGKNVDNRVFTESQGKDTYFYFSENLKNQSSDKISGIKNLVVLYDVSDSAKNRDVEKEIEFLKKIAPLYKNQTISVITFANDVVDRFEIDFTKRKSDAAEKLRNLKFDGATNLDVLKKISVENETDVILFSDGLDNWGGEKKWAGFRNRSVRICTVNSSKSANFSMLQKIAGVGNGVFVNLQEISVEDASSKIFENPLRVISVEYNDSEMAEVFPTVGTVVENGISVAGILKKKNGKIKITLGRNGSAQQVIEKNITSVAGGNCVESKKVSHFWAMKKIADLESDSSSNRNEIIETAKKFSVVTDETSLIVLDSVQDYVRYGIVPPEELMDEYNKIVANQNGWKESNDGIPSEVFSKFKEYKAWWNKNPKDFLTQKKEKFGSPRNPETDVEYSGVYIDVDSVATPYEDVGEMLYETAEVPLYRSADSVRANSTSVRATSARASEARVDSLQSFEMPASNSDVKNTAESSVKLQSWSSKADYIATLKRCDNSQMYEKYLELKKDYGSSPAFFMEVSDYFIDEGLLKAGKRILSNLAEMNLENTDVLRALGNKLMEHEEFDVAAKVFEKLTTIRKEVPQFFRDLALAYEKKGDFQKAVDSLWHIASRRWDSRYAEIQQTALNDMNAILENHKSAKIDTTKINKELMQNFDVDLRIVLTWNTDDCDIDLWVTDPNNEKCYYGHKLTQLGGRMSRDFTQGYGPEEFSLKVAPNGKYKIECNYYGNHQQKLLQPVIVQAEVYTNFGRPNQKKQIMTLQLDDVKQTFFIGEIEVK